MCVPLYIYIVSITSVTTPISTATTTATTNVAATNTVASRYMTFIIITIISCTSSSARVVYIDSSPLNGSKDPHRNKMITIIVMMMMIMMIMILIMIY